MKLSDIKVNKLAAEFIGTFALGFGVLASINGFINGVPTAVVAGFVVFLGVLGVGAISGAHLNPAVTLALYSLRKLDRFNKIDGLNAVAYIIVQLAAGFFAMIVMNALLDKTMVKLDGGDGMLNGRVFLAEILGTGFFVFGIAAAIHNKLKDISQAALIGGSLTLGIIFASAAGSLGVLNPAVAAALGVFNWSYMLGPLFGALIGANVYVVIADKK